MNKPFDLAAALNGAPVVNGKGTKVSITKLSVPMQNGHVILSQDDKGIPLSYHAADGAAPYNYELYMDHVAVNRWINIYNTGLTKFTVPYHSEAAADKDSTHTALTRLGNKAFPITYEE